MGIPCSDISLGVAGLHEARLVMGMTAGLATAVARHVLQNFRMLAGKLIDGARDIDRTAGREPWIRDGGRGDASRG